MFPLFVKLVSVMVLCRTFHTTPEQGQKRMGYLPIFQVPKVFQVVCFTGISMAFRCLVLVPNITSVKGFRILSALVSVTAIVVAP